MKICYGSHSFFVFFCFANKRVDSALLSLLDVTSNAVTHIAASQKRNLSFLKNTSNHLKLHRPSFFLHIRHPRQLTRLPHHLVSLQIDRDLLLLLLEILHQIGEQRAILLRHQRNREARRSRTARSYASLRYEDLTSNSVDVELQRVGHVVIDD